MIFRSRTSFLKVNTIFFNSFTFSLLLQFFTALIFTSLVTSSISCSSSVKFTGADEVVEAEKFNEINVLLSDQQNKISYTVLSDLSIEDDERIIALISKGNVFSLSQNEEKLLLEINGMKFSSPKFIFSSRDNSEHVNLGGKVYRGKIKFTPTHGKINIINVISLEDYVKGVLPKEMPTGNGYENFEALKAVAICIRTYAIQKIHNSKNEFDIYTDERDQVYGSADSETQISNLAVDETQNMILTYKGETAQIFYHSTCGGETEATSNVFQGQGAAYMNGVKDGSPPNCRISPRFEWIENYSKESFVKRIVSAGLLADSNYAVKDVIILSRFPSGRVNELQLDLQDSNSFEKHVSLFGNSMRSIIRNSDNSAILRSTLFDIETSQDSIKISGRGNGHGVGLCQWGAIYQSQNKINYRAILDFYFPGTEVTQLK
jgi:stage II sporulation protein D